MSPVRLNLEFTHRTSLEGKNVPNEVGIIKRIWGKVKVKGFT